MFECNLNVLIKKIWTSKIIEKIFKTLLQTFEVVRRHEANFINRILIPRKIIEQKRLMGLVWLRIADAAEVSGLTGY